MTVLRRGHGAVQAFATSAQPPYPTGAALGDACYLWAVNTATISPPGGSWTEMASASAGGYNGKLYKQEHPGGTPTAPIVTATGGSAGFAWMEGFYTNTAGASLSTQEQIATDVVSSSTAFSATGASATSLAGDVLLGLLALKSATTMSATHTSPVVTQAGATVGTQTGNLGARLASASPTNSLTYGSYHRSITSGATGAPAFTATAGTGGTAATGLAALVLLREVVVSNVAPTANAGVNQTVLPGVVFTVDGSGSTDSDGTITTYTWTQTAGDTLALSGSGASRTATAPYAMTEKVYTYGLVVTDDDGANSTQDTVTVTVPAHPEWYHNGTTWKAEIHSHL